METPETRSLSPERTSPRAMELSARREKGFVGEALLTATGLALVGYGLLRRNPRGTLLMAAGTVMGAMGIQRLRGRAAVRPTGTSRAITVLAPRHELYRLWRDFSNLPRFMQHIEAVEDLGGGRHRWHLRLSQRMRAIEWETVVVEDRQDEIIAWKSVGEGAVEMQGRVEFAEAPGNRGTEVHATIIYEPRRGAAAGRLLEPLVAHEVREDLRRLKQLVETGAIPRTEGQPTGRERKETRAPSAGSKAPAEAGEEARP